jgi:hypothetical protein
MTNTMTGGCACGRIRYSAQIESLDAGLCHCRMCQRATGGFAAPLVAVPPGNVTWEHAPDHYASSPIARRLYCRECGSPLGWETTDGSDLDLALGSFDDPSPFRPVGHGGAESMLHDWIDTSALPMKRSDEIKGTVERWQAVGMEVPQ